MFIEEFEKKYCLDILEKARLIQSNTDDNFFSYDRLSQTLDGKYIKVIDYDEGEISLEDIISLDEVDFCKAYKSPKALEKYREYLSKFIITRGEEALREIRMEVASNRDKISHYASIDFDDL